MPSYDYKCTNCDLAFETIQGINDDKLITCPECEQETLKRLISGGGLIKFNGEGFHCNDYGKGYSVLKGKDGAGNSNMYQNAPKRTMEYKTEKKAVNLDN